MTNSKEKTPSKQPSSRPAILDWDLAAGLLVGFGVAIWYFESKFVTIDATTVFLAMVGVGAALTGAALAAMTILAAFIDEDYRQVLAEVEGDEGIRRAWIPFKIVASVSALLVLVALAAAIAWPESARPVRSLLLGGGALLTTWAVIGACQLVALVAFHAEMRTWRMSLRARLRDLKGEKSQGSQDDNH